MKLVFNNWWLKTLLNRENWTFSEEEEQQQEEEVLSVLYDSAVAAVKMQEIMEMWMLVTAD